MVRRRLPLRKSLFPPEVPLLLVELPSELRGRQGFRGRRFFEIVFEDSSFEAKFLREVKFPVECLLELDKGLKFFAGKRRFV